jgi:hypothetical protein
MKSRTPKRVAPDSPGSPSELTLPASPVDISAYSKRSKRAQVTDLPVDLVFSSASVLKTEDPPGTGVPMLIGTYPMYPGVYLLPNPTRGGKTILSSALTAFINTTENARASMLYVFERGYDNQNNTWSDASKFLATLESVMPEGNVAPALSRIAEVTDTSSNAIASVLVIDSITLPLLAWTSSFGSEGTQTGGFQPAWLDFVTKLESFAVKRKLVVIAAYNADEVPGRTKLEGAVEGIIDTIDIANFKYTDHASRTLEGGITVSIPVPIVNAVLARLGYGTYVPTQQASDYGIDYKNLLKNPIRTEYPAWAPKFGGIEP